MASQPVDPTEKNNLLSPICPEPLDEQIHTALKAIMLEQRKAKRLLPHNINNEDEVEETSNVPLQK